MNQGAMDPVVKQGARAPLRVRPLPERRRRAWRRILLIANRQIGDVLLATPLLRSLRQAFARAEIDVLVYRNTGGMLQGNPDLDALIEVAQYPDWTEYRALFRRIRRRYDLAVSVQAGDRAFIYALIAAPVRVCLLPDLLAKSQWKRMVADGWALLDNVHTHTVEQNLALARALGVTPVREVVPPQLQQPVAWPDGFDPMDRPFAVVHPYPMWRYKRWTAAGWRRLADALAERGLSVVVTGGPAAEERAFCAALQHYRPDVVCDLAAQLDFAAIAAMLRRATLFVGPDTAPTHLAAACGTPTLALFGPSNPVKWGPWPAAYTGTDPPFAMYSREPQRVGNVLLLQPDFARGCVPCREEGCERHKGSSSDCLESLPVERVVTGVDALLAGH